MDPRVARAVAIMEERLHTPVTAAELAASVGLSVSRLTRLFQQETGTTPSAYLHRLRMTRARLLVERSSLPVHDVMAQVGIADPSHFARDFRRAHGFSPRMLRQQLRASGHAGRFITSEPDDVRRNPPNGLSRALTHGDTQPRARSNEIDQPAVVMSKDVVALCYVCPTCAATDVQLVIPSEDGAYCRCRTCGHLWHDRQKPPPRATPSVWKRRKDITRR